MKKITTKTALITGALGGIGKSICKVFDEDGWTVIGTDIRMQGQAPHCHVAMHIDLDKLCKDNIYKEDIFHEIISKTDKLDVLVNNAAVQLLSATNELKLEDWYETMNINLTAPMLLSQLFLPMLKKSNGSIVNIASIHQQLTKPRFVSYATSKSALVGLTKAMAVDLQGSVRVNCISPAAIGTDMLRAGFNNDEMAISALGRLHPVQRIGYPEEVAKLALFLASEEAKFINGANLQLDGGISSVLHDL
ncbi:MAG: SDR family oxidoreductase [Cytophagales bacterium]|nr:MAG: SDR family oxidoreductase [Cytophagales bacterium]